MKPMGITMFTEYRRTAVALLAVVLLIEPAAAIPANIGRGFIAALPSGRHLADGTVTAAPQAFSTYCGAYVDQCSSDGSTDLVVLDAGRWADLQEINADVNRRIHPRSDDPGSDVWSVGATEGDCDDYAVEKRKELLERGWPSASLSLAVAFLRTGEAHLLLTVRTDRGDFALDNLRSRVIAADRTGYRFVARQSTIHPRLWVRVDGVTDDVVVTAKAPVTQRVRHAAASEQREIVVTEGSSSDPATIGVTPQTPKGGADGDVSSPPVPLFEGYVLRTSLISE